MRLTVFLIVFSVAVVMANTGHSQEAKITLQLKNATLSDVLNTIENNTSYYFMLNNKLIDLSKRIDIDVQDKMINEILALLSEKTGLKYKIYDRQIVLSPGDQSLNDFSVSLQQKSISGKVTDSSGASLPGVSVVVKGTSTGVITDVDGKYTLSKVPENATLQFSFVGMKTLEIQIAGKSNINITLTEETVGIEEVVAVGYGVQKKENLTGAISQVKVERALKSRPVSNLAVALKGSMPDVQITTSSGRPGESSNIDIRGVMSINGGSPLVLVDNVPMDIDDVNPADIESVSVLKDAASASIYGGRAAFGVILITTKKASRNEPIKFDYKANFIFSQVTNLPEKASALEMIEAYKAWGNNSYPSGLDLDMWKDFINDYHKNPTKYPKGETSVNGLVYPLSEYDPTRYIFEGSFEQIHNLSFSGGTEKSDFRGSFGYSNDDGVIITNKDSYKKYNFNLYLNTSLSKKIDLSTNILYLNDISLKPSRYPDIFQSALRTAEVFFRPASYYTDANGSYIPYNTPDNWLKIEPADQLSNKNLRIFEKLTYTNKNFKLTGEFTYIDSNSSSINSLSGRPYVDLFTSGNINYYGNQSKYYRSYSASDYYALNIYMDYEKAINFHNFKLKAGTNQELSKYSSFWANKTGLVDIENPSLATAIGIMTNGEAFSDYAISGYFARLNYSYKNKYLLEANMRYDGSSKFPTKNRFGFFPSFSAGWIISEEPFLKPIENTLSFLKIRGSWGEIGNQSIDNYAFIPGMSTRNANWIELATNSMPRTINPPALVSGSFTWETVRTKNAGIDINFFNNKLSATFDYYVRETNDMLGPGSELPKVLGTSAPQENMANLESKGWGSSVSWNGKKGELNYSFGINVSDNRGYVTKYKNKGGVLSQYYEGYEFGEIWGYVTDGYFTVDDFVPGTLDKNLLNGTLKDGIPAFYTVVRQNPGDIRFKDLNNDGKISPGTSTLSNPGDRKIIGNDRQRYQFGVTATLAYKNIDMAILIDGVGKRDIWPYVNLENRDDVNFIFWPYNDPYASIYKNQLDYWTPENTNAYYMRSYNGAGGNTKYSRNVQTKYLLNGAYLRVRNIEIGYTVPKFLSQKLYLNHARLFLSVENLLKFDHLPNGMDSEVTGTFNNGGVYPYYRKFNVGINVSF